jgi:uncharacterized protein (UPF0333 family)
LSDGTLARVSDIKGVDIATVGVAFTSFSGLEIVPFKNSYIGILDDPHNLNNAKNFRLNSQFELNKKILTRPLSSVLSLSVPVDPAAETGIVTYFNVNGNLDFPLKENDVFTIIQEKVKILSIDKKSSRIKVERGYQGSTLGISTYDANTQLVESSRKLTFNLGISTNYNFRLNKEYYFNPVESIGIGTVGISTLYFSNPGLGLTFLTIPNKTIFIENHQLVSGDSLFYSSNGASPIEVSFSGIGTTSLQENQQLFVGKVNNDLISISTTRSPGNELSFVSIGSSDNHSFKTNFENNLIANISSNIVTVTTNQNHNLNIQDKINLNVISGVSTTYNVFYNDTNRRFCVNKKSIESVNVVNNIIVSTNHKFRLGEKVIYEEDSSIGGLVDQQIYYVIPINKNEFKLSSNYYGSISSPIDEINLTSSGSGFLYSINPKIEIIKNQDIVFDVSDSSLSYSVAGELFPAFDLKLFSDKTLINEYFTYDLNQEGIVGIDSTAKYTLKTSNLPNNLYYAIIAKSSSPIIKREIFFDDEQVEALGLEKIDSKFSGQHQIISVGTTTFSYELLEYPEIDSYQDSATYTTNSKNASGPILDIKVTNLTNSNILPGVSEIKSQSGSGVEVIPVSSDIGKIENIKKLDIGFDYNVDYTIRPKTSIPKILRVESLFQLDAIDVKKKGFGYSFSPDLVLIDSTTRIPYECELEYDNENNKVNIIQNTNRITGNVEIVPISNDNGFDIDEITFNSSTKIVTVKLKSPFNSLDEFPFNIGEKVFIENIPVIGGSGYNSANYGYRFFEIISSTPNIGGIGATFTYLLDATNPGTVDNFYTSGFAIPEKYLPEFDVTTKTNTYFKGEFVKTVSNKTGEVSNWDPINSILKIISNDNIEIGDVIFGQTSKNYSTILEVYSPGAYIDIESNSIVNKGWNSNVGFLNDSLQRLHDSDYYQYFSYDLRSEESYSDWTDTVDSLNHTAGFKKFGNLLINTTHNNIGFNTEQDQGTVEVINDLQAVLDVNCFYDFDLVTENYFDIDGITNSNEIYFNSRRIQNYIESIGNKAVVIDDISDKFLPVIRDDNTTVDEFNKLLYRYKKYLIHVFDRIEPQDSQALLVNALHNDQIVAINQYAINDPGKELGTFSAEIDGLDLQLKFFPFDISNKLYSVNSFSFNISDSEQALGTLEFGDTVVINSHRAFGSGELIGIGTTAYKEPATIVSIPETKTAAKVLIVYSDKQNRLYYSDEINYLHDGATIISNSYGELNLGNPTGIGTYNLYYDNSNVNIDFYPNDEVEYEVNSLSVEFSDDSSTTTDTVVISGNVLESSLVGIATTDKTLIYSYTNDFKSGLHQILVEDINTGDVAYSEFLTMLNSSNQEVYIVEFGNLNLGLNMGSINVEYSNISGDLEIYFTASAGINCEVRTFSNLISRFRRSETLEL